VIALADGVQTCKQRCKRTCKQTCEQTFRKGNVMIWVQFSKAKRQDEATSQRFQVSDRGQRNMRLLLSGESPATMHHTWTACVAPPKRVLQSVNIHLFKGQKQHANHSVPTSHQAMMRTSKAGTAPVGMSYRRTKISCGDKAARPSSQSLHSGRCLRTPQPLQRCVCGTYAVCKARGPLFELPFSFQRSAAVTQV
jgi:hypothetical protein